MASASIRTLWMQRRQEQEQARRLQETKRDEAGTQLQKRFDVCKEELMQTLLALDAVEGAGAGTALHATRKRLITCIQSAMDALERAAPRRSDAISGRSTA